MRNCKFSLLFWKGFCGLMICMTMMFIVTQTKLAECVTDSLSGVRYVLFLKSSSFTRGDIVLIQGHTPQYIGTLPFAKRILGLPGDKIQIEKNSLKIGSYTLPLLTKTTNKKPLTPLSFTIIPEGYAFVAGDHPHSFDSRYGEFGLVSISTIYGKGILVW